MYHELGTATLEGIKSKLPKGETELTFTEFPLCAKPYTRFITSILSFGNITIIRATLQIGKLRPEEVK